MLTAYLGDLLVTMVGRQATPQETSGEFKHMFRYSLMFRDMVTGEMGEVIYASENDAVLAFAAWLAADEPRIGSLASHLDRLNASLPPGHKFLP